MYIFDSSETITSLPLGIEHFLSQVNRLNKQQTSEIEYISLKDKFCKLEQILKMLVAHCVFSVVLVKLWTHIKLLILRLITT